MKHLKLIMTLTLAVTTVAVVVAAWYLISLYNNEKQATLNSVRECAENAILLEMIDRMLPSEDSAESFMRLNAFLEMTQQKDGRISNADTLQASLAGILSFGLEFKDGEAHPNEERLNDIFKAELNRHSLKPKFACILPANSINIPTGSFWTTTYRISNSASKTFDIYVSPMPGKALSGLWGIIIPFVIIIALFSYLTAYLSKTLNQLKTLEQMKDDFTHNMTHELKTPVAVAYSAADSMLRYYDQSDEARNKQFLRIILQRLSFLSGMIENILSMSMERFKTMQLNIEQVALKPLVGEIARMIELKTTKRLQINIEIPDNLSVQADALHFGNMLSNLMDNAVKYSNEIVEIDIRANNNSIVISDNGIGIEKGCLPFIFDKFYRVSSGDMYEVGGYGLGLFYVKQIVDLHAWRIDVASKPGQGTTFTIKFKDNEER